MRLVTVRPAVKSARQHAQPPPHMFRERGPLLYGGGSGPLYGRSGGGIPGSSGGGYLSYGAPGGGMASDYMAPPQMTAPGHDLLRYWPQDAAAAAAAGPPPPLYGGEATYAYRPAMDAREFHHDLPYGHIGDGQGPFHRMP